MRRLPLRVLACLALPLFVGIAVAAKPSIEVSYADPTTFTDAGDAFESRRAAEAIAEHLRSKQVAAGQHLVIRILDIGLAGERRLGPRNTGTPRVMNGGADWPRVRVRYTLEEQGHPVREEEELISDPTYMQRPPPSRSGGSLTYEKRMLDEWFERRFGSSPGKGSRPR